MAEYRVKVLVIVPAYNEETNLPFVLRDLQGFAGDVLVVNDGSKDASEEVARSLGASVVSHPFNLGIGGSVQTGLLYALRNGYDYAIQFDGDGQHRADQIGAITPLVEAGKADLVIGARTLPEGYKCGFTRKIGSLIFRFLILLLTGKRVSDPTAGFRCYGPSAIRLFSLSYPDDYPEVESIITASRNGLTVSEVPVLMRQRQSGHSSINRRKSAYYMLKVTLAMLVDAMRSKIAWKEL
jgi:glycosyltransferase involved in cell wall biosynthesis